jgi:hypothetical protein
MDMTLPAFLLNSTIAHVKVNYVTDALLKHATLEDMVIIPEKDDNGNVVMDDNGIKVMVATTIKGVAIKSIRMDILHPFCIKVGIQKSGLRARSSFSADCVLEANGQCPQTDWIGRETK